MKARLCARTKSRLIDTISVGANVIFDVIISKTGFEEHVVINSDCYFNQIHFSTTKHTTFPSQLANIQHDFQQII